MGCKNIGSSVDHIMLAGTESSGKTYWLYSKLKKLIHSNTKIQTTTTYGFNYETIDVGHFTVGIWDLPGKENLRLLWPNFYRNIDFSGVMYVIDYGNKDSLNDAVRVMHELLNEEELIKAAVLVILNFKKKEDENANKEKNEEEGEQIEEKEDEETENKQDDVLNEMKKTIYFHLIPQVNKKIFYLDMYDLKPSANDNKKVRLAMIDFIQRFS